jgi:UDP-glucose 4-epimerase
MAVVLGTDGVRDCIYVMDVAEARGVAMDRLADEDGLRILNIGTGTGVTLQLVPAFQEACGDVRRRLAFAEPSPAG